MDYIQSKRFGDFYYAWTWSDIFGFIWSRAKIGNIDECAIECSAANSNAINACLNKVHILARTLPLIKA